MEPRIDARRHAQEAQKAMYALEKYLAECGLEHRLIHLMKMRASQINGCAYCIDMHSKDARALGETEQRLYELDAWRETLFYSDRERAALAWTEAITLVSGTHVPDSVYEEVRPAESRHAGRELQRSDGNGYDRGRDGVNQRSERERRINPFPKQPQSSRVEGADIVR
jgi:AhpD family alkylhydroperoxidase